MSSVAQNAPAGPEQHEAEAHTKDRIDQQEPGELNHECRHDNEQAADEGLNDVPKCAFHVQVALALLPDQVERNKLGEKPARRGPKHRPGRQLDRVGQPHRTHYDHDERHAQKEAAIDERSDNLGAVPAETAILVGGAAGKLGGDDRD